MLSCACCDAVSAYPSDRGTKTPANSAKTAGNAKVGKGCVIVKLAKPQQDLRLDLPSVGLTTLENAAKAGVTAIVVDAGKSLIVDVENFIARANELKIAIVAIENVEDLDRL